MIGDDNLLWVDALEDMQSGYDLQGCDVEAITSPPNGLNVPSVVQDIANARAMRWWLNGQGAGNHREIRVQGSKGGDEYWYCFERDIVVGCGYTPIHAIYDAVVNNGVW